MNKLSIVIITLNEEYNIRKCLESVKEIADEIVVLDSFSTDKTEEICLQYENLTFFRNKFENYGVQKQLVVDKATNDWVLSIDADEILSLELIDELTNFKKDKADFEAYNIGFQTFYQGKILKYSLSKEKHLRLFNKKFCKFSDSKVHEKIIVDGNIGLLGNKIIHNSYRNLQHHLEKANKYTSLFAEESVKKNKSCCKFKVITRFGLRFFSLYFIKLGFLDGYSGFIWAIMGSYYSFLKYAKLYELNHLKS